MCPQNLIDATLAPSPEGGWSGALVPVTDALVATTPSQEMIQPMGIFDAKGRYVHEAVLWRGKPLMVEPPERPEAVDHLPGRWIWGGVLLNHFGHFLTESIGRLWALDAIEGPFDGIVFVPKREDETEGAPVEMQPFHRLFFDLAGVDVPIRILSRPTRIERLEVPGQGFGIGPMAAGTAAFRDFMARRFAQDIAATGGERLYISRSGLSAQRGGILWETRLEELLAREGYEIFHPQRHSMSEQIARYKAARQIVALDGSALHLVAMSGVRGQRVAMIKRRDSHASDSIITHLASFLGVTPDVIDVIRQDWVRADRKRADRFSIGELDFAALGRALAAAGYIAQGEDWPALSPAEVRAAISAIEATLQRRKLTFAPLPRRKSERRAGTGERAAAPQAATERIPERRARRLQRRAEETGASLAEVTARAEAKAARKAAKAAKATAEPAPKTKPEKPATEKAAKRAAKAAAPAPKSGSKPEKARSGRKADKPRKAAPAQSTE